VCFQSHLAESEAEFYANPIAPSHQLFYQVTTITEQH